MSEPISQAQFWLLVGLSDGGNAYDGCRGRSEYGGRTATINSLIKRELISSASGEYRLTKKGADLLDRIAPRVNGKRTEVVSP
jgi:hypothetical protein